MNEQSKRAVSIGLLSVLLSGSVLAEPHGGGPGGEHGGGLHGPEGHEYRGGPIGSPAWDQHGPRHGYGLPDFAREVWIGSMLYFFAAGTYYLWNADRQQYVVVSPPPAVPVLPVSTYEVIAYPSRGQGSDQQARDRYECHRWAVSQSGFDPSTSTQAPPAGTMDYYRRALTACLVGRGYTVN